LISAQSNSTGLNLGEWRKPERCYPVGVLLQELLGGIRGVRPGAVPDEHDVPIDVPE
jgi:hypothetical protein